MALIVYGGALSPFVRKVRVMLIEKSVDYTLENVNPFAPPPEFLAISPLKRIPVLRDTDQAEPNSLADSSVICDYIEQKYPTPALYPADPFTRAQALWYEEYADTASATAIGPGLFFERVVKKLLRQQTDEAVVAKALAEKIPPVLNYFEKEIGNKTYFAGDAFSIADISVATSFVNFHHAGEKLDAGRHPKLAAYIARIHARPSFAKLIAEERPFVSKLMSA